MLTLYEHPFALYCQKVLVALNELGVAYEVLEEQRDFERAELARLWPPASIPVLRDADQVIGESSIIIEYVAGPRRVPSLEARKWDRICDEYVSNAVQAIVADTIEERFDQRTVTRARGRLDIRHARGATGGRRIPRWEHTHDRRLRRRSGTVLRPGDP